MSRLSDVALAIVDCEHKTAPTQPFGIPSVRTTNIKNGRLDLESANRVSEETYREWTTRMEPQEGDLILAREAPVGEVGIVPWSTRVCLGQRTVLVRPDPEKAVPRYLLYLLLTPQIQHELRARSEGSTTPHLNVGDIREFELPELPELPDQERIAHILGTLDDKIEVNRRMNRTLEAIARAIFKSWFVDFDPVHAKAEGREPVGMDPETAALFPDSFQDSPLGKIPKGWEVGCLEGLIACALGGDWGKAEPDGTFTEPVYCIRGTDLPDLQKGDLVELRLRYLKPSSLRKRALQPDDLIFEVSGGSPTQSTGRSLIVNAALRSSYEYPLVCTNFCRLVRPRSTEIGLFIALLLNRLYSLGEFFQHETGTTTIKNFAFAKFVKNYQVVLPDERVLSAFSQLVKPLLAARDRNGLESSSLSLTRDTLMPKLISGDLRVKDAKRFLERSRV